MGKAGRGTPSTGLLITAVAGLSFITFLVVLDFSIWITRGDPNQTLAFGQLCFDALLFPTAVIGFYLAIRAFRKSQRLPELDLRWQEYNGTLTYTLDTDDVGDTEPTFGELVLVNRGSSIEIWYLIHIEVPDQILLVEEIEIDGEKEDRVSQETWTSIAGKENENWHFEQKMRSLNIQFMSMGKVASYPEYPLVIGRLNFHAIVDKNDPTVYEIPYSIFTDRGKVATETEHLTVRMFQAW